MFWSIVAISFLCHIMCIISATRFKPKYSQLAASNNSFLELRPSVNLSAILLWDYLKWGSDSHKYCGADKTSRRNGFLEPVRTNGKGVDSKTATEDHL